MSYIGNQPTTVAFVTDTFSGNGSTVAFTMSQAPATTTSIIVSITGVLQDPSTYSVSGTTLTFSAAPPSGTSNISVRFLGIPASGVTTTAYRTVTDQTATAGQTSFTVPSYTVGYIDVFRNGVRLGAADYTATTGTTVVLTSAASVGDLVTTVSFYVSSVLNAIPAQAGEVGTTYLADAGVTQAKLAAGVAGNGPAFSATRAGSQSVTTSTWTKVQLDSEDFDTANCFDSTTNYRFTPNVAGYYQVNCFAPTTGSAYCTANYGALYKNGSIYKREFGSSYSSAIVNANLASGSYLVYLNGTTDYIEMYAYVTCATSPVVMASTTFSASLVRAA